MPQTSMESAAASPEINLRELVLALWDGRGLLALIAGAGTLAAILYAFLAPAVYRSEALLQPQELQDRGTVGSVLGQLGGLADLTGLTVGPGAERAVALATLKSRTVVEAFIREEGVMPRMYDSEWDAERKAWKAADPGEAPSLWEAYEEFTEDVMVVSEDKTSGLVTVAIEWKDPAEAQRWASALVARTNRHLKSRAIDEGDRNLAYLQAQLGTIGQVELRQALYGLVEAELKKVMLAKGSEEFALKTIDPAVVPMERERPKRAMVVVLGFLSSLLAGAICVFVRREWASGV